MIQINLVIGDKIFIIKLNKLVNSDQLAKDIENSIYNFSKEYAETNELPGLIQSIYDTKYSDINDLINKSNNKKEDKNIWSFNYINKKYNIKKLLINNRNLIYGAIIQFSNNKDDLVLYPIDYFYNNTDYPTFNIINNNSLKDITEANVIKFLKKSELIDDIKYYFKDSENNYFALKLLNKKIFYFNQTKKKILEDIDAKYINFPLYLISFF